MILRLALPAVAMMACHFSFNLIDSIWVGRLIGAAALAAVSTAGFYVWVLLSLGEMVEVGLIAVAARRHGEGRPDAAARAAGAAVLYALAAGTVVSLLGLALTVMFVSGDAGGQQKKGRKQSELPPPRSVNEVIQEFPSNGDMSCGSASTGPCGVLYARYRNHG